MTKFCKLAFLGFLTLLASCTPDDTDPIVDPGVLVTIHTDTDFNIGERELYHSLWIAAFDRQTEEYLGAMELIPGETTTIERPEGFDDNQFDLAWIGVIQNEETGERQRVTINYFEDVSPYERTYERIDRNRSELTYFNPAITIDGVTVAESEQYQYTFASGRASGDGYYNNGNIEFPSHTSSATGNYLVTRYDEAADAWAYQMTTDHASDDLLSFSNSAWTETASHRLSMPHEDGFNILNAYGIPEDTRDRRISMASHSTLDEPVVLSYPELGTHFPLYGFHFYNRYTGDGYKKNTFFAQEGTSINANAEPVQASVTVTDRSLEGFAGTAPTGNLDFVRTQFAWLDLGLEISLVSPTHQPLCFPNLTNWPSVLLDVVDLDIQALPAPERQQVYLFNYDFVEDYSDYIDQMVKSLFEFPTEYSRTMIVYEYE